MYIYLYSASKVIKTIESAVAFAIYPHNGYPVAPDFPHSIANRYICPHVAALASTPLPSSCHNHYPIFEAHYHCQIMIIASVFDIHQPKWRLSIVDCLRHCWHIHTQPLNVTDSSDNNHESIRFSYSRGELSNIGTLRRTFFGQFYRHFANAQSIFANQTREILHTHLIVVAKKA